MDVANQEIKKCYYDPFVEDPAVIEENLQVVNELLPQKQEELDRLYK